MQSHSHSSISVQAEHQSGWWVVIFPSLLFISIWLGTPALAAWFGLGQTGIILSCLFGILLAAIVTVAIHPFVQSIAARGRGSINLEDHSLRWQVGRKQHSISLKQPYHASIAADVNTQHTLGKVTIEIESRKAGIALHWADAPLADLQENFPAAYFITETPLTPEEGNPGFKLDGRNPAHQMLFKALLTALWQTRQQNRRFQVYQRFPWEQRPRPRHTHILVIDPDNATPAEMELLSREEQSVFFSVDTLKISPNYVLDVDSETICAMPIGYIQAKLPTGGLREMHNARANLTCTVVFTGRDSQGKTLQLDIPLLTDKIEEITALTRYINWWYARQKKSLAQNPDGIDSFYD